MNRWMSEPARVLYASLTAMASCKCYNTLPGQERRKQPQFRIPPDTRTTQKGTMPHRPRARRYPFVASIELTETESEEQVWGQTTEVSLFGCRVEKVKLLPPDTKVSIRIVHLGHSFLALGRVVYARGGMGIVFTKIEGNKALVLEKWIAELRPAHNH